MMRLACLALAVLPLCAEEIKVAGLEQPVEILRDRWGVPHIYAKSQNDLFFAQGWMAAKDRLWQIDFWRRMGAGKLSEVMGPVSLERDRFARLLRFRGDWKAEWTSYSPDTYQIAKAFTDGINAYVKSLKSRPLDFRVAGYDPGLWAPEDVVSRLAGISMMHNLAKEVARARDIRMLGLSEVQKYLRPDPPVPITIPNGLDLTDVYPEVLTLYSAALKMGGDGGSNNWVVSGQLTKSGKPILANDPHRNLQIPSLRKTVHLVAPGWNVIGAGEPALPGVALGHNEHVAFGFTIAGIDQQDLYVETLHPMDDARYRYKGEWKSFEVERQQIAVKDAAAKTVELRYSIHGPVLHLDTTRRRAYVLKSVAAEPGSAGYLAGIALARARNWKEFAAAAARYKTPAENLVYADKAGNIGWYVAGTAPVRRNWSGLLPVPGQSGEYEWSGFLPADLNPHSYNPKEGWLATANNNTLPQGYPHMMQYEYAPPWRVERIRELLKEPRKWTVDDFTRMQQDVTSHAARRFQQILKKWQPKPTGAEGAVVDQLLKWNCAMTAESTEALIYSLWLAKLRPALFSPLHLAGRVETATVLDSLEKHLSASVLLATLKQTTAELEKVLGTDRAKWRWGSIHTLTFLHPLSHPDFDRGPMPRPGDATTVNAASGANFRQTNGASYRQVMDVADWDKSVMTNVPGESGDPTSPHYADLINGWATGAYHPMPYSRKAVEAATEEKILLVPLRR